MSVCRPTHSPREKFLFYQKVIDTVIKPFIQASRTDRFANFNFGMGVKWKDFKINLLGQCHRSKDKVTRTKNVHWDISLKKKRRNTSGSNTTWGGFKVSAVSFFYLETESRKSLTKVAGK